MNSSIQKIYVINLDRQVLRWEKIKKEICSLYDNEGESLLGLTERFSAVDGRCLEGEFNDGCLQARYSLADQLFVEPNPLLSEQYANDGQPVDMTQQEIAVALSHIEVWKRIAYGNDEYALVLEDDIIFSHAFSRLMNQAWDELNILNKDTSIFDVLYLSYEEAKGGPEKKQYSDTLFRPIRGLWCLAGYVLSKNGAKKLLRLLPVRGPVDMWINFCFKKIDVYAVTQSIINQRRDLASDNVYSILPILSKFGVLNDISPSIYPIKKIRDPVFVFGEEGGGLTSLAMALSMLGYRCCSDSSGLPDSELNNILKKSKRIFDAYVNIGVLENSYKELLRKYKNAKFIMVTNNEFVSRSSGTDSRKKIKELISYVSNNSKYHLVISVKNRNKWEDICNFLECDPPNGLYPYVIDIGKRRLLKEERSLHKPLFRSKHDNSPWVVPVNDWGGFSFECERNVASGSTIVRENFSVWNDKRWTLLNDTFPSNLSIFDPENFIINDDQVGVIILKNDPTSVREYKSASLKSRSCFLYGRFSILIKPARVPGTITGVFLHRNTPRQEIDLEFLGKDTTKILVNVFYNPGSDGARFDYGYRGSPEIIELGFDASMEFHLYCIEWTESYIKWFVDGNIVHERRIWDPTPIPHLPLHFYVNLWPSRSEELAGKLPRKGFENVQTEIKSIVVSAT